MRIPESIKILIESESEENWQTCLVYDRKYVQLFKDGD